MPSGQTWRLWLGTLRALPSDQRWVSQAVHGEALGGGGQRGYFLIEGTGARHRWWPKGQRGQA